MSKYKELDAAIVRAISFKVDTAGSMEFELSVQLCELSSLTGNRPLRILDARLQALRKKGRIKFSGILRKWEVVEVTK